MTFIISEHLGHKFISLRQYKNMPYTDVLCYSIKSKELK